MQISNSSTSSALANLLQAYKSQTKAASPADSASGAPASASPTDTASFSAESLKALEENAALAMFQSDNSQNGNSGGSDLASLLGGTDPSSDSTDPLMSLFGAPAAAAPTTPKQLVGEAQKAMAQAESSLFGNDNTTDSSTSSNGLSSLMLSFEQSIVAQDNLVIQKALARTPVSAPSTTTDKPPAKM